jgi:putative inorganic carbon (hco3(-)) transporter
MDILAVLLTAVVVALLPICVWRPWIGVLVFAWLGFMNPHRLVGGFAYDLPFSKIVAVAMLLGLLFTKDRYAFPRTREVYLLAGFWLALLASTAFAAIEPERAWVQCAQVSKVFLMTMVTLTLFQDQRKLRLLLIVSALSIGLYCMAGGIWGLATGFREYLFGPPGSAIDDNNLLAFATCMVLPLLALFGSEERAPLARGGWLIIFGLSIVALFATYSRGSLVTLCIVLPLLLIVSGRRCLPLLAVAVVACLAVWVTPRQWLERMETITPTAYKNDASGAQRMKEWYVAFHLGLDRPWLGAGFRPFSPKVYESYIPGYRDYHDAHNHFLQVFAEHGFTGLALYFALLASVLLCLVQTMRATRGDPERRWLCACAGMFAVSNIAYMIGGLFVNAPYFDLYYDEVAAAVILSLLAGAPRGELPTVGKSLADTVRKFAAALGHRVVVLARH